jgi:hypothetical protein
MEMWRYLQCKSLTEREKSRRRKSNGKQWKEQWKAMEKRCEEQWKQSEIRARAYESADGAVREAGSAVKAKSRPKRPSDARMSLCTCGHAPFAPGMQAEFNLSPLFTGRRSAHEGCRERACFRRRRAVDLGHAPVDRRHHLARERAEVQASAG